MSRILLIEPDHILAKTLKKSLARAGHKVDWLVELQAAINATDKNQPDIIVMDLLLAERSGIEFLFELRSYPEWVDIPVVILSSVPEAEISAAGRSLAQLGVDSFFYKPAVEIPELLATVSRLVVAAA